jgi:hypothetical protein
VLALLVLFGFGAALVGIARAAALATSPKRAAILSLCGVLGIVASVVAGFVSADTTPCNDCSAYLGRYVSPLFLFFGAFNVAGWYGGVAFGATPAQ